MDARQNLSNVFKMRRSCHKEHTCQILQLYYIQSCILKELWLMLKFLYVNQGSRSCDQNFLINGRDLTQGKTCQIWALVKMNYKNFKCSSKVMFKVTVQIKYFGINRKEQMFPSSFCAILSPMFCYFVDQQMYYVITTGHSFSNVGQKS